MVGDSIPAAPSKFNAMSHDIVHVGTDRRRLGIERKHHAEKLPLGFVYSSSAQTKLHKSIDIYAG